jgi:predicted Zn-dependent protease
MPGQQEAQKLCQRILKRCGADPAEVLLFVEDNALTRFANNAIHQNVAETNANLIVRYFIGQRIGAATTNRTDEAALDEIVAHARANATASAENPNYPGLPEPATYTLVESFDQPTASFTPEARARAVAPVCKLATEKGLNASGAFSIGYNVVAIANSRGVFAYHHSTHADFQTVVMGEDASGHAHASAWRVADIATEDLGREAIHKAERGRNPRKIEPGKYAVVLDPYATEDILDNLNFHGMGAQAVLEERSWMNDRLGQKVLSNAVSIWDDGCDAQGSPMPFDFEGVPKQRVDIVKEGVVISPVYDRYTGKKAGKPSTGHALPPNARGMGPIATNIFMASGSTDVDEMIRSTERGLYITRFWYTRLVHPRDCVITGMTRDGVFMIENGELSYPIKNLRFTHSYVEALANVEAISRKTNLLTSEFGGISVRVPALKISNFNFTGSTV